MEFIYEKISSGGLLSLCPGHFIFHLIHEILNFHKTAKGTHSTVSRFLSRRDTLKSYRASSSPADSGLEVGIENAPAAAREGKYEKGS